MMAAYVKFMEASGARVVPLIWNEPDEVLYEKLSKLNGVLFPGGDGDYVEYGRKIINKLIEYNDNGQFYPAMGICLGFENLHIWASDAGRDILVDR
jgi:gamma-glutamyl hydrolase